jgi:hypothetical protein
VIARADIHVLDEPHDDAGAAEVRDQVEQGVIVHARCTTVLILMGARPARAVFDAVEHLGSPPKPPLIFRTRPGPAYRD